MTTRYQPQFLWLFLGPLLGALCGTGVGAVLLLFTLGGFGSGSGSGPSASATDFLVVMATILFLGAVFGGTCGAVTGFFVGIPLVFLVGRHLPRDVARRRAWVLGGVLPPVALVVTFSVISGEVWILTEVPQGNEWWGLAPFLAGFVLGGALAAKAAALDELPKPVS